MKKPYTLLLSILSSSCLWACEAQTPPTPPAATLEVSPQTVNFTASASSKAVEITTNQESWTAQLKTTPQGWTIAKSGNKLTINVSQNTGMDPIPAEIVVKAGELIKNVTVTQAGEAPAILLDKTSIALTDATDKSFSVVATANVDITTEISASWITQNTPEASGKAMTDRTYTFTAQANTTTSQREGTITFASSGASAPSKILTITQPGFVDPTIVYQAKDLTISGGVGGELTVAQYNAIKTLQEGTIIIQHKVSAPGTIQSLFGIGDNTQNAVHLHIYINGSTIGFETRGGSSFNINGTGSTTLPPTETHTIALKATKGEGYKIFANGKLVMDKAFNGSAYKFISDLTNVNAANVGKAPRISNANGYPYTGNVKWIKIHSNLLSDDELIRITSETPAPQEYIPVAHFNMFSTGDATGCDWFRIPSLLALKNGNILASIDARFGGTYDSPNNLDNTLRRSTDGGKNFGAPTFPLEFLDYPHAGGNKTYSASFIDPVLMQNKNSERVYMLVDAFSWGGGIATGGRCADHSGFKSINGKAYQALTNATVPTDNAGKDAADQNIDNFNFSIRENGVIWDDLTNSATQYSVNGKFQLLENGVLLTVKQFGTDIDIPMSIYYERSKFRVLRTSYLWIIHSDDNGVTWSDPINVSYLKKPGDSYFIAGPGNSIQIQTGSKAGRLLFPVYFKVDGTERCAVIYSDDNGLTWKRGETPALGSGVSKMSEAQLIELPDGSIAIFARNGWKGMISYAISKNGGETFETAQPTTLQNAGNNGCQISIINLSKTVDGSPAVAVSYSDNADSRINGTIAIGLIKGSAGNYSFEWKYKKLIKPGDFGYSCLTELPNGNLGLLYEGNDLQRIKFMEIDLSTIMTK